MKNQRLWFDENLTNEDEQVMDLKVEVNVIAGPTGTSYDATIDLRLQPEESPEAEKYFTDMLMDIIRNGSFELQSN